MTVASKAVGLSFALGLIARQATAVDFTTCETLRTAVAAASAATTFTIAGDLDDCAGSIVISGTTTIDGGGHTLTISPTFLTDSSSVGSGLFVVEAGGTLELNDVTVTTTSDVESEGVRGIYNEGTLTVNNCVFSKLNTNTAAFVDKGAAVSCDVVMFSWGGCCLTADAAIQHLLWCAVDGTVRAKGFGGRKYETNPFKVYYYSYIYIQAFHSGPHTAHTQTGYFTYVYVEDTWWQCTCTAVHGAFFFI